VHAGKRAWSVQIVPGCWWPGSGAAGRRIPGVPRRPVPPNTVRAAAYDLKVFFAVAGKAPDEVRPADVLRFITAQRTGHAPEGPPRRHQRVSPGGVDRHRNPQVRPGSDILKRYSPGSPRRSGRLCPTAGPATAYGPDLYLGSVVAASQRWGAWGEPERLGASPAPHLLRRLRWLQ
jgi:hypothetical protein